MKLKNCTNTPDEEIKEIIRFAKPNNVSKFDVTIRNRKSCFSGHHRRAGKYWYTKMISGKVIHDNPWFQKDTQIVASVTRNENEFPLYVGSRKGGYLPLLLLSREEALVYVLAHELRHAWQTNHKRGRVWGSRGRYSERDADFYAIGIVREWRRKRQRQDEAMMCFPYTCLITENRLQNQSLSSSPLALTCKCSQYKYSKGGLSNTSDTDNAQLSRAAVSQPQPLQSRSSSSTPPSSPTEQSLAIAQPEEQQNIRTDLFYCLLPAASQSINPGLLKLKLEQQLQRQQELVPPFPPVPTIGSSENLAVHWTSSYIEDALYVEMCESVVEKKDPTKQCKFCGEKIKRYYHEAAKYAGIVSAGTFEDTEDKNKRAKEKPLFQIYYKYFSPRLEEELKRLRKNSPDTCRRVVQDAVFRIFRARHKLIFYDYIENEGLNWRFVD